MSTLDTRSPSKSFKLFDLRVEVVIPDDERDKGGIDSGSLLPCNAHIGDHFELQGELLYLPPGQGMSIYSIG